MANSAAVCLCINLCKTLLFNDLRPYSATTDFVSPQNDKNSIYFFWIFSLRIIL